MDYQDAIQFVTDLRTFGIKLGNERMQHLATALGNPELDYGVAHVAGTKGKGSTTVMVASILQRHGFRVGSYFSPFVYDIRERIQCNGEMIPREEFARAVEEIAAIALPLADTHHGILTEFEMKTLMAFLHFRRTRCRFAAIEVGMGGRLDATNIVVPEVTVITNIGLDHTQYLGDTHALIAAEKAGIIKPGVQCFTATDEPSALEVITETARLRGAPLQLVRPYDLASADDVTWKPTPDGLTVETRERRYTGIRPRLQGDFQYPNAACAVAAVEVVARRNGFTIQPEAVVQGIADAWLPGRLQQAHTDPLVLLDGAHNQMAARSLRHALGQCRYGNLHLVVGMIVGHDADEILSELAPPAHTVYATQPTWDRRQPAEHIAEVARRYCPRVVVVPSPLEATRAAMAAALTGDLVLVTGSFYTLGDVRPDQLDGPTDSS